MDQQDKSSQTVSDIASFNRNIAPVEAAFLQAHQTAVSDLAARNGAAVIPTPPLNLNLGSVPPLSITANPDKSSYNQLPPRRDGTSKVGG